MQYLSQSDPRWSSVKLGSSTLTMGRFGCTTTCLSMLSDYFECYQLPDKIASHIDWYTTDGLIIWSKLNFTCFEFESREYVVNKSKIIEYINDPNKAVILEVNNKSHWVVAVEAIDTDFYCADPINGKKELVLKKYNNITGMAFFKRKNISLPTMKDSTIYKKKDDPKIYSLVNGQLVHLNMDFSKFAYYFDSNKIVELDNLDKFIISDLKIV